MDKPAASSLCTENVGVCLFGYEICRPCSGQLWPFGMLAVAESSLCVGVFGIHRPGFCGGRCKRRRISSVGVITDEVQKRLLERLSKGYLGAYLWESGIRGQDVENCLKAERRSGVAVLAISALQNCMRVYESLKIDEVRAMRQHFPMNLHGKQIGHVLGYIPGALYGQAVLQGMSRAYQGVLEEANWRIVEFRLRPASSTTAAPPANLLAVAQSKAVPPASGVSGFDMGLSPPTPPAFNTPGKAFSLLRMSRPAMPAPVTPEGVFGSMPVGGSKFSYSDTPIATMTPAPMTPDIPQATMTTAPMTPDILQATMTSPPTTYPFQMEENLPMPPPPPEEYAGVPTTPPMPRLAGVESPPPPPSPDAMSEASDSAVLERGF